MIEIARRVWAWRAFSVPRDGCFKDDHPSLSEAIEAKGESMFRHACRMGLEGIVSKRLGSPYVSGRTRHWLETKNPNFERV
jgi:ATP-dependent DNA ligase